MSSDYDYINEHMGGHDEDGLPNFMSEPGFSDDSYNDEEDEYENYNEENSDEIEEEHEIGDTVRLKSGGPLMTIEEVDEKVITCRWFNKQNDLKSAQFYKIEIEFDTDDEEENETYYSCDECDWSGTEDQLDQEDCPECGSYVTEDND